MPTHRLRKDHDSYRRVPNRECSLSRRCALQGQTHLQAVGFRCGQSREPRVDPTGWTTHASVLPACGLARRVELGIARGKSISTTCDQFFWPTSSFRHKSKSLEYRPVPTAFGHA